MTTRLGTVKINVPWRMVNILNDGRYRSVNTLTPTGRISRRGGVPAVRLTAHHGPVEIDEEGQVMTQEQILNQHPRRRARRAQAMRNRAQQQLQALDAAGRARVAEGRAARRNQRAQQQLQALDAASRARIAQNNETRATQRRQRMRNQAQQQLQALDAAGRARIAHNTQVKEARAQARAQAQAAVAAAAAPPPPPPQEEEQLVPMGDDPWGLERREQRRRARRGRQARAPDRLDL